MTTPKDQHPWGTLPGVVEVEATARIGDVTWTVHVALPDYVSAVDLAREAIDWAKEVHDAERVEEQKETRASEEAVLAIMGALGVGPKDMRALIEATGLSDITLRKHLRNLEAIGKVSVATGARGKKTYALPFPDNGATFHVRYEE